MVIRSYCLIVAAGMIPVAFVYGQRWKAIGGVLLLDVLVSIHDGGEVYLST